MVGCLRWSLSLADTLGLRFPASAAHSAPQQFRHVVPSCDACAHWRTHFASATSSSSRCCDDLLAYISHRFAALTGRGDVDAGLPDELENWTFPGDDSCETEGKAVEEHGSENLVIHRGHSDA